METRKFIEYSLFFAFYFKNDHKFAFPVLENLWIDILHENFITNVFLH